MEKHAKSFLFQSLSMTLFQRGNACVIGAAAHHRALGRDLQPGKLEHKEISKGFISYEVAANAVLWRGRT